MMRNITFPTRPAWLLGGLLALVVVSAAQASEPPERAVTPYQLLDRMEDIRQRYPKLYDRLRRSPEAAERAGDKATSTAAPAGLESKLKQEIPRPTRGQP